MFNPYLFKNKSLRETVPKKNMFLQSIKNIYLKIPEIYLPKNIQAYFEISP